MRKPSIRATGLGMLLLAVLYATPGAFASEYTIQDWRTDRNLANPIYDAFWGDVILRQSEEVINDPEALLTVLKRSRSYRNICRQLNVEDLDVTYVNPELIRFYVDLSQALRAGRSAALAALPPLQADTSHAERSRIRNQATAPFADAIAKVDLLRQASIRVMLTGGDVAEGEVNQEVARIVQGLNPAVAGDATTWVDTLGRQRREAQQRQEAEEREAQASIPTQAQIDNLRARILQARARQLQVQERLKNPRSDIVRLRLEADLIRANAEIERLRGIWETSRAHDQSGAADPFEPLTTDDPDTTENGDLPFKPIQNPTPSQIRRFRTQYLNQRNYVAQLDEAIERAPSDMARSMLQIQRAEAQEELDNLQVQWDHYKQYDPTWTE